MVDILMYVPRWGSIIQYIHMIYIQYIWYLKWQCYAGMLFCLLKIKNYSYLQYRSAAYSNIYVLYNVIRIKAQNRLSQNPRNVKFLKNSLYKKMDIHFCEICEISEGGYGKFCNRKISQISFTFINIFPPPPLENEKFTKLAKFENYSVCIYSPSPWRPPKKKHSLHRICH